MKKPSEYPSGRFVPTSQMVNPSIPQQGYIPIAVRLIQYPTTSVFLQPNFQAPHQQYAHTQMASAVPPPPTTQFVEVFTTQVLPTKQKISHAVPIKNPVTLKNIFEEDHSTVSSLHPNAPNFEPTHSSGFETQGSGESVEDSSQPENELKETAVNLNDTIESEHLAEEFSFENDEDPSITASIRQIPSNLEQKLGFDDEVIHHSTVKATILPTKQESHSSLPETFHCDTSRKFNRELYSQSPPFRHNYPHQSNQHFQAQNNNRRNFHQKRFDQNYNPVDLRQFQPKHNNHKYHHSQHNKQQQNQQKNFMQNPENNNFQRNNYENDFNAMRFPFKNFPQKNYNTSNSQSQKVDQECTAHPIKDLNQNYIIDGSEQIMELKDLKLQQTVDENNNNQTEEFMTGESLESTAENTEGSLNSSRRYTTKELTGLRKSPLVLSKPPTERDKLLDSNLDSSVWKTLFDKNNHRQDFDSNDSYNMSQSNNNKNSNLRRTNSNMRYDNNHHNQLTRSTSASEKQYIKLNLSLNNDVKLNTAENAWKPAHMKTPEKMSDAERQIQDLIKNFRALLNKITEENFEYLVQEVNDKRKYVIDSSEKLNAVVDLLFEKSVSEPGYAATYAKLCQALSAVHVFNVETNCKKTKNPWKKHLVSRCQYEFERSSEDELAFRDIQEKIKIATDSEEIENLENVYFKLRQRANGTFKFIGELYKIDLLTANIMKRCIEALLCSVTEENIERLCKLFTTVGEKLEGQLRGGNDMDVYMRNLEKLKCSSVITTSRIKFEIMNVIDLRATNWKQRENARSTKPQKLQELQEEEEKRKRKQQQQLNEYNERQHRSHHNNFGRQKSQRTIDSEGFRMSVSKQIDMNKVQIPRKNDSEVRLGPPPGNFYQNFNKPMSQMAPPPTSISNPFANLSTDCDEPEQLAKIHHTRSGSSNKNNRKDKDNNNNNNHNNSKKGSHSNGKKDNQTKKRTPSPEIKAEQSTDFDDDFFMIDLTDSEDKDMRLLMEKMQQILKGKIIFDMLLSDLKKIKITKNVLGYVYNDLFDKRSNERKGLIELIGEISRKGFITKTINVEALKIALKAIPSIICDVPFASQYFSEYCVYFIETGLLAMKDIENICENEQNILEKIVSVKTSTSSVEEEVSKAQSSGESEEFENSEVCVQTEQNDSSNAKPERCLKSIMELIQFKLKKKHKDNNFLEEIYKCIDKEDCQSASNFIKDLTTTLLKACCEKGRKKAKKSVDLSKLFPVFIRYINNDKSSQIDCINAIQEFVFSNPENNDYNLYKLFDLFYDNDVISVEAFKFWKEQQPISPKKREAIKKAANFFTKLEEIDLSSDFNCTSSTIKD